MNDNDLTQTLRQLPDVSPPGKLHEGIMGYIAAHERRRRRLWLGGLFLGCMSVFSLSVGFGFADISLSQDTRLLLFGGLVLWMIGLIIGVGYVVGEKLLTLVIPRIQPNEQTDTQ